MVSATARPLQYGDRVKLPTGGEAQVERIEGAIAVVVIWERARSRGRIGHQRRFPIAELVHIHGGE